MFSPEIYITSIAIVVVLLVGVLWWVKRKNKVNQDTLNLRLLSVRLPRDEEENERADETVKQIALSEQLYATLSSIGQPFIFEVAVHHSSQDIHFYDVNDSIRHADH